MIELLKTPTWLKGRTDMPDDDKLEPPPIATLPEPASMLPSDDEDKVLILGQASLIVKQFQTERAADRKEIEKLRIDLAEKTLLLESEQRKSAMLEADLAEAHNNIQALESTNQDKQQSLQRIQDQLDRHGTVRGNGKRNGNGNKKK